MRLLTVAAVAIAASGCAVFEKPQSRAAASPPAPARAAAAPERFTPAFGAGAPYALMPCRREAGLGDTCRRFAVSHERRGDMLAGENAEAFSDATTVSLTKD
ncbi:MAG: hypothetical protein ACK4NP_14895 [Parvularculaceae bacterium]